MPFDPPNLDDRRYEDLFEEMRSRIRRYAPEWTDRNLSDPGITLMQLFAWLGDITLYRLNRVPERNYIKFLQLLGIERKPATPARVEVTFTVSSGNQATVTIPKGTQVVAETPPPTPSVMDAPTLEPTPEEEPLIFETDEPLIALAADLKAVQVFTGTTYVDYLEANNLPTDHYPVFGAAPREGNALLLGLASDAPFPTSEINLMVRSFQDADQPQTYGCELPQTSRVPPPATLAWEFWDGSQWRSLKVIKDDTWALTRSGHVYFQGPDSIRQDTLVALSEKPLYWLRCRLVRSQYERIPELEAVLINTVSATAVVTVEDEILGSSNGLPNQVMALSYSPVYAQAVRSLDERLQETTHRYELTTLAQQQAYDQTLRQRELLKGVLVEVDEGNGLRPWEEVSDFYNSRPEDAHYLLNRTTGEIRFGNGEHGRIPTAGINNVVARYYRYGGGTRTNVGAGALTEAYTSGIESVTNHWPATGGTDEEPIKEAKARAPQELKVRDRAVTNQDFEFLARQAPRAWVRRAHGMPLYHPDFPDIEVPGVMTVVVVPEGDKQTNWPPMPSESTMKAVCAYLNQRRLLTTELIVAPPKYKQVSVAATVIVQGAADPAWVKTNVEKALNRFLDPLEGGEEGKGWPWGRTVFYSEVFQQMLRAEGVDRVEELRLIVDGRRFAKCENVEIPLDCLVYAGTHELSVVFSDR